MVYFLVDEALQRVKVGKTRDLQVRKRDLENDGGRDLVFVAAIDGYTVAETRVHRLFRPYRAHGREWFHYVPEVRRRIQEWAHDTGFRLGG